MAFALRLSRQFFGMRPPAAIKAALDGKFARSRHGGAAVEFAIVAPVLLLILSGIFTYGGYFLTAHTIQQTANDAARSAIAGLDDQERALLAEQSAQRSLAGQHYMRGELRGVTITRAQSALRVEVIYDASEDVYWSFQALLPVPSPVIRRSASIRLGGY